MAGLQRSEISFRRQGSSGLVWEDRLLTGEFRKEGSEDEKQKEAEVGSEFRELRPSRSVGSKRSEPIKMVNTIERSRSSGGRGGGGGGGGGFRTGKVAPSLDPPSPKLSGCCGVFGKPAGKKGKSDKVKSSKANK